jgi:hypothetical protein
MMRTTFHFQMSSGRNDIYIKISLLRFIIHVTNVFGKISIQNNNHLEWCGSNICIVHFRSIVWLIKKKDKHGDTGV